MQQDCFARRRAFGVVASLGLIGSQSQSIKVEISLHPLGQFGWNFGKLFSVIDLKFIVSGSILSLGYVIHGRSKLNFSLTPLRPNGLKRVREAERLLSDTLIRSAHEGSMSKHLKGFINTGFILSTKPPRSKMSSSDWISTQIFTKLMKSDGHLSMLTFCFT